MLIFQFSIRLVCVLTSIKTVPGFPGEVFTIIERKPTREIGNRVTK